MPLYASSPVAVADCICTRVLTTSNGYLGCIRGEDPGTSPLLRIVKICHVVSATIQIEPRASHLGNTCYSACHRYVSDTIRASQSYSVLPAANWYMNGNGLSCDILAAVLGCGQESKIYLKLNGRSRLGNSKEEAESDAHRSTTRLHVVAATTIDIAIQYSFACHTGLATCLNTCQCRYASHGSDLAR
ncbi:hypothetical protein MRB53_038777 [Persea americana]|nr:hypothetical protein MRB53_038777 [Persea americana]